MSILVIAVGVLLFTAPKPDDPDIPPVLESPTDPTKGDDGDLTEVSGTNPVVPPVIETSPVVDDVITDSPAPTVQSVQITYANKDRTDITLKPGESVVLRARVNPVGTEEEIVWTSSNINAFEVVPTNAEATQAKLTYIGKGNATLTVAVGGIEAECIVRCR